jgi:S1-C subfamily serine protease
MSGGPLLNQKGELVGISGRHPVLWENSDNYEDGSQPSPDLQTLINNSSWAIPSEQIIKVISDK